jgi:hypothetical protein
MIKTELIGQPTIIADNREAERIARVFYKPRMSFRWNGEEQVLYVSVPDGISPEYVQGFRNAVTLHLLMTEDAWFSPLPKQPYCLCILDREPEPLVLGFTPYDWIDAVAPVITQQAEQARAVITLPNDERREVALFVGARR